MVKHTIWIKKPFWLNGLLKLTMRPAYPSTSKIDPDTMAMLKPRNFLDMMLAVMKPIREMPKSAANSAFAGTEGRYPQYERLSGHVSFVQLSRHACSAL